MLFIKSRQGDLYIYSIVILILIRYIICLFFLSVAYLLAEYMIKLSVYPQAQDVFKYLLFVHNSETFSLLS